MTPRLSDTERFVLERTSFGDNAAAIASILDCSVDAVKRHRQRILAKLGVSNAASAVRRGFELGILGAAPTEVEPLSDGQLRAFHAKASQIDRALSLHPGSTAKQTLEAMGAVFQRDLDSVRDLTAREANQCLDHLSARIREEIA